MAKTTKQKAVPENFLTAQMELLEAGDTAGLAARYAEDAVFMRVGNVFRGRAEIKRMFDDYLAAGPEIQSLEGVEETNDVILYQAKERLGGKLFTAVGTLVFADGLVKRQTAAFVEPFTAA